MNNLHFLVISVLAISVGLFIFLNGKEKESNQSFFIVTLAASGWLFCLYFLSNTKNPQIVLFLARLSYAAGMLAPAGLLHFVHSYPNTATSQWKKYKIYLPALIISLLCFTNLVVEDCQIHVWGVKATAGKAIIIIITYFLIYLSLITIKIIKAYRTASPFYKKRWLLIIIGLPLPLFHILITNIILPRLAFEQAYKLGPYAALEMAFVLGYAIYKYYLFDIKIIIRRTLLYSLLILFNSTIYLLVVTTIQKIISNNYNLWVSIFISSIIVVLTIRPLYRLVEFWTDRLFYRKQNDYINHFEKIYDQISYTDSLNNTLTTLIEPIVSFVHFTHVSLYLKELSLDCHYTLSAQTSMYHINLPTIIQEDSLLIDYLNQNMEIIDTEEKRYLYGHITDKNHKEIQLLDLLDNKLDSKMIVPLKSKEDLLGFISLGTKLNKDLITEYEKIFFRTFSREASNIIENNRLYNEALKNERLALIGTMSSSFAHEIRNPLAAINSYIDLLRDRIHDEKFLQQFYKIVPSEIKRLSDLTEDLLNFAKADKQQIEYINLNELVTRAVELVKNKLQKKEIDLTISPKCNYSIQADRQQIYQTVLNILLNAIHAVDKQGKIAISLSDRDGFVIIAIRDNGRGISKRDISKIFEPFYSTKIYGTGLGLTTCKRIVEAHKGYIHVESEENQGCTFEVHLPLQVG